MLIIPFICALFLLFPQALSSQALSSQDLPGKINFTDEKGMRQGLWEQRYPNGNLRYRGVFHNNHPAGEFTRYFPDGSRMALMNFCREGVMADAILYYEDGSVAATGRYINEKKDSTWKYFSPDDNRLIAVENWSNGLREGLSGVCYPDGRFSETFWYENDRRNGPWKQYYNDGTIRTSAMFRDDLRHGEFEVYSSTGTLQVKGNYYRDRMHGEWFFFDEPGKGPSVIVYDNGIPVNEDLLLEQEQDMFRNIERMRGQIPEPDESELFFPGRTP